MGDTGPSVPPSFPQNSPPPVDPIMLKVREPTPSLLHSLVTTVGKRCLTWTPAFYPGAAEGGLGGKDRIGAKALKLSVCWEALGGGAAKGPGGKGLASLLHPK